MAMHRAWALEGAAAVAIVATMTAACGPAEGGTPASQGAPAGSSTEQPSRLPRLAAASRGAAWAEAVVRVDGATLLRGAQAEDAGAPGYDPDAGPDEAPVVAVAVSGFWLDRFEVTAGEYRQCVRRGYCHGFDVARGPTLPYGVDGRERQPITGVTWQGARGFCRWRGGRLPREAEWELAARGAGGRRHPTGRPSAWCRALAAAAGRCDVPELQAIDELRDEAPSGAVGMTSNAAEWVADWYAEDAYGRSRRQDPVGPSSGPGRVVRGGRHGDTRVVDLRAASRRHLAPSAQRADVGFRCAYDRVPVWAAEDVSEAAGGEVTDAGASVGPVAIGWEPTPGVRLERVQWRADTGDVSLEFRRASDGATATLNVSPASAAADPSAGYFNVPGLADIAYQGQQPEMTLEALQVIADALTAALRAYGGDAPEAVVNAWIRGR